MNHAFELDPLSLEGDCLRCGLNIPHPEPAGGPLDDVPLPRLCPDCRHFQHDGRCWGAVPAYPEPKPCLCGDAA